mgnify:CR=1 FL=1
MMMPANFSAISENEMTYVNGGAIALEDILAPRLTVKDWQRFNQNMVTIIGNQFVGAYVKNTIGQLFGGSYVPGNMGKAWVSSVGKYYNNGRDAILDPTFSRLPGLDVANGVLNAGLRIVGSAAAIYNLATGGVKNDLPSVVTVDKA